MAKFLVFRISAALGSMGGYAGNHRRGSESWLARSALNGLLGAALGVDRSDSVSISALELDYVSGVVKVELGSVLTDFQTAQSIPRRVAQQSSTRRQALYEGNSVDKLQTILSEREYYESCNFFVIVKAFEDAKWSLENLRDSLLFPKFLLYLGRKSCPLMMPLNPKVYNSNSPVEALNCFCSDDKLEQRQREYASLRARFDPALMDSVPEDAIRVRRRDRVINRERWLFAEQDCFEFELNLEMQQ